MLSLAVFLQRPETSSRNLDIFNEENVTLCDKSGHCITAFIVDASKS